MTQYNLLVVNISDKINGFEIALTKEETAASMRRCLLAIIPANVGKPAAYPRRRRAIIPSNPSPPAIKAYVPGSGTAEIFTSTLDVDVRIWPASFT